MSRMFPWKPNFNGVLIATNYFECEDEKKIIEPPFFLKNKICLEKCTTFTDKRRSEIKKESFLYFQVKKGEKTKHMADSMAH